jgi:hypothetical protein
MAAAGSAGLIPQVEAEGRSPMDFLAPIGCADISAVSRDAQVRRSGARLARASASVDYASPRAKRTAPESAVFQQFPLTCLIT